MNCQHYRHPLVLQIVGKVDRSHPALTDLPLDAVAAFDGRVQAGDRVWVAHAPKMRPRASDREQMGAVKGEGLAFS